MKAWWNRWETATGTRTNQQEKKKEKKNRTTLALSKLFQFRVLTSEIFQWNEENQLNPLMMVPTKISGRKCRQSQNECKRPSSWHIFPLLIYPWRSVVYCLQCCLTSRYCTHYVYKLETKWSWSYPPFSIYFLSVFYYGLGLREADQTRHVSNLKHRQAQRLTAR